ncbi:hypothetical protein [Brevundimonas sp.]
MPHRAPRILTLLLATAVACLTATAASAQSGPAVTRYLSWANRPVSTTPADVTAAQARTPNGMIPRRVAPSQGPYQPVMRPPVSNVAVSRGLTPASAWLGPRVAPTFAPGSPEPLAYTEMAAPAPALSPSPAPVATPAPRPVERAAVDPMAPRRDAPVFNLQRPAQPVMQAPVAQAPVEQAPATPAPQPARVAAADTIDDPTAPRRDARIFQMQQTPTAGQEQAVLPAATQAAPTQPPAQTAQSGARYYSVHRDAGHRPDPTALPEPVYFDSVSLDLAEPPAQELPLRDAQGRRRAVVQNEDPSLP